MENEGMEDDTMTLTSPENSTLQTSEIAPLQLETNSNKPDKCLKDVQDGLKVIITSSVFFAISVTIALILTIYLAPPQVPPHAAVVSDSKLCSNTGERLLLRGGSAVDAAVAVVLCEGLVNPHHSGIGGGGFMIIRKSKENTTFVIDFMDAAPKSFSSINKDTVGLQVGVPGMLRGLELAQMNHGKLRWLDVVMAVVEIAYSPVNISSKLGEFINAGSSQVRNYFDNITLPGSPDKMNLTKLGWLLLNVANHGADAFYNDHADEILSTVTEKNGGVMTKDDLKGYKAYEREPVRSTFLNMAVETVPSPGGGPLLLLFLNMMENLTKWEIAPNSTEFYHLVVEALKFTYGHQSLLGDTEDVRERISSMLISKSYASSLAARFDLDQTHQEADYYSPGPELRPQGASQISVLDSNDDMVSVTVSLNGVFGSGLVTESGIILNSHMLNFATDDKNKSNDAGPGKRPFDFMSPTIIYNPNRPCGRRFALGGANGETLLAGLAQVIINVLLHNMPIGAAVDSPRLDVHMVTDQGDETIYYEDSFQPEILQMLKMKQHEHFLNFTEVIGVVHVVAKINETVAAKADFRSGGEAVIY